jgi:hypothetical protein
LRSVAVLALQQDAGLGVAIVNRQHDDRPGVPDDVAPRANSAGFFDMIGSDVEHGAPVRDARGEDAGLVAFRTARLRHDQQYIVGTDFSPYIAAPATRPE